ncbi:MAG: RidA family protein [Pseudomonadota bacterium]|nr:RidA family protein [Pseudomonadota bacterium]
MLTPVLPNPETDAKLAYSQGILATGAQRVLHIAGQVGLDAQGVMAPTFEGQVRQAWDNLIAVLTEADMTLADLCKVNIYLTNIDDYATYGAMRGDILGPHKPASTLVVVSHLARPDWLFEVDAMAMA